MGKRPPEQPDRESFEGIWPTQCEMNDLKPVEARVRYSGATLYVCGSCADSPMFRHLPPGARDWLR